MVTSPNTAGNSSWIVGGVRGGQAGVPVHLRMGVSMGVSLPRGSVGTRSTAPVCRRGSMVVVVMVHVHVRVHVGVEGGRPWVIEGSGSHRMGLVGLVLAVQLVVLVGVRRPLGPRGEGCRCCPVVAPVGVGMGIWVVGWCGVPGWVQR